MSFSGLQLLQKEATQLHKRRKADLEPMLQKGFALLNEAEEGGFSDREALTKASQIFLKVLICHRSDIRPYLFVAYVFILLKNFNRAQKYLDSARTIQHDHLLLIQFQNTLKSMENQTQAALPSIVFQHQGNPEDLFLEVKQELIRQVKSLTELWMPTLPLHPDDGIAYQSQLVQFDANFEAITEHLRTLDREVDTLTLRVHLRPFEVLLRRHKAHLAILVDYQNIKADLLAFKKQINWAYTRLETRDDALEKEPFEEILENLLDQCDLLADQIDEFEKQQQNTQDLEEIYHQILPLIEQYQELLDQ